MTLIANRPNANGQPFDDAVIVARLKAGDMSACKACVQEHSDALYRLAFRLLRDEAAAEDVVQETFPITLTPMEGSKNEDCSSNR